MVLTLRVKRVMARASLKSLARGALESLTSTVTHELGRTREPYAQRMAVVGRRTNQAMALAAAAVANRMAYGRLPQ